MPSLGKDISSYVLYHDKYPYLPTPCPTVVGPVDPVVAEVHRQQGEDPRAQTVPGQVQQAVLVQPRVAHEHEPLAEEPSDVRDM